MTQIPAKNPGAKPKLQDVAQRAGVSIGTVSRVLTGKSDVAPDFVARVQKAAAEIGYIRHLPKGTSPLPVADVGSIGYLVDAPSYSTVANDPFQKHFLSGIEQGVTALGGRVIFATVRSEIEQNAIPSMIREKLVKGVIVKGGNATTDAWLQKISDAVPLVTIMHNSALRQFPTVMCDNFGGMFQILTHLSELGHTRFGFLYEKDTAFQPSVHHIEREEAFIKYAPQFGCPNPRDYVQTPIRNEGEEVAGVVTRAMNHFLAMENRPTAIICAADVYAFCLLRVAPTLGISIPGDLSVASFMNTESCDFSNPPLTSVALSGEEIGSAAVDLLQARIRNPLAIPHHITVNSRLVKRQSCGPIPVLK